MVKTRIFRTVVAPSMIEGAGLGLFAGEFIPKGSHLGEYGGQKLQRGRKEACELRKRKHDTHVKRLGSIMHGDFMDARVTKTMTVGYYCDNGLVGSFINTRGNAGGQQQQEVNVKEVEYEQYFCHPYSLTEGVVTCRTFYVTLVDLYPGMEIFTDYGNDYRSIHLRETDSVVNNACKSCVHQSTMGCMMCKGLQLCMQQGEEKAAKAADKANKTFGAMQKTLEERVKKVENASRNHLTRPRSDAL